MIYITGDTHGDQMRFLHPNSVIEQTLMEGDYLIICGDFGYLFTGSLTEQGFLDDLSLRPYTILFIDGNHENFNLLNAFPVESWNGGKVHFIRGNKIIHLMRGQVFTLENSTFFTFGGAHSIDKHLRQENISWWKAEMPTEADYQEALVNLAEHNNSVDYILTHTAPEETMQFLVDEYSNEQELNIFLEWLRERVEYRKWFIGHLHLDKELWRDQQVVFTKLIRIRHLFSN